MGWGTLVLEDTHSLVGLTAAGILLLKPAGLGVECSPSYKNMVVRSPAVWTMPLCLLTTCVQG